MSRQPLLVLAHRLAVDAATVEAVAALRSAGVESIVLRGPAIAERLYGGSIERTYVDADLLVETHLFLAAEAVLASLRYEESRVEASLRRGRPAHAHTWTRSDGRVVDLHTSLIGVRGDPRRLWNALRLDAETVDLCSVDVLIPSQAGLALIIALHFAHHGASGGQALRDLEIARDRLTADEWAYAARLAREVGAEAAFSSGLGRRDISPPRGAESGSRTFHVAQGFVWLRQIPGAGAKAHFLWERLVPPRETMKRRSSLARRGAAGLVAAYLLRLVDAAIRVPSALAALRRTR